MTGGQRLFLWLGGGALVAVGLALWNGYGALVFLDQGMGFCL